MAGMIDREQACLRKTRRRSLWDVLAGKRARTTAWTLACTISLAVGAVFVLSPIVWMISTSLKNMGEVFIVPPRWVPKVIRWDNYPNALRFMKAGSVYRNTVVVTVFCLVGEAAASSLVAYGFSRVRAPGRDFLFMLMLGTMMLPNQVTLIPQFVLFKYLGWLDSFKPLVVPSFFGTPFFIFLLRQFYLTIPLEMDEAARLDGCGYFQTYLRIVLPLCKPALGVVAIQSFMFTWNDFMRPLIYLNSRSRYTAALALRNFTAEYGMTPWNELMAASLVMLLPCIVLFFVAQRYFVEQIVFTGIKA